MNISTHSRSIEHKRPMANTILPGLLSLLITAGSVFAQDPNEKGRAIAEQVDQRTRGFGDYTADLEMILRSADNKASVRTLHIAVLEMTDDGNRSLIVFDTPEDIRGTALLTHSHPERQDDQWLYLPAVKRVKRISANNRSGAFMSSEFSYEDFSERILDNYTYRYLGDETCAQQECFVIEQKPKSMKSSGYRRLVAWIDKVEYRTLKVDYYDRRDACFKTLLLEQYQAFEDRFWRSLAMKMVNHQTGKSTDMIWSNVTFKTGLTQRDMNQTRLTRTR